MSTHLETRAENYKDIVHFLYVPFTGLGLYGGSRGNTWLKNRIQIFKQYVVPSLTAQTSQNFSLWISWRPEERKNELVQELETYLVDIFGRDRVIFTYHGVCFWDDKYPPDVARRRLLLNLHYTVGELSDVSMGYDVLMTIQPSDDCYVSTMVAEVQNILKIKEIQATGYRSGYIMHYPTGQIREYNPLTIPPFFTIKFKREVFIDPFKHAEYTGPYESHEYIAKKLNFLDINKRGFLVGTHGENISTHFKHPFAGDIVPDTTRELFGIMNVPPLKIRSSIWKMLLKKLPHRIQRKVRYIFGELLYQRIYSLIH